MRKRILPLILFVIYLFILIKVLVLKDLAMVRIHQMRFNFGGTQSGPANLIPFKTILYYLKGNNGLLIACINIIGNIIALVPLGFLVPLVILKINWKKILALAIISGLVIEWTQFYLQIGIFDIDDVLLNGLGVIIGFWKFNLFKKFPIKAQNIIGGIILSVLGLFFLLLTLSYFKIAQTPIGIEPSIDRGPLPMLQINSTGTKDCCDLCGGTGGTGEIIHIGENDFTIKSKKGIDELIRITTNTQIKNSKGNINKAVLKIGNHVTVVIDETETASLVLVCGIAVN
jgi:glycopeptide antibiotics resistance protein